MNKIKQEFTIKFTTDLPYDDEDDDYTKKQFSNTLIKLYKDEPEILIDNLASLLIDKKIPFDVKIKNIKQKTLE
jgi:hypothetical protein